MELNRATSYVSISPSVVNNINDELCILDVGKFTEDELMDESDRARIHNLKKLVGDAEFADVTL